MQQIFLDPSFRKLNKIKFPNATSKLLVSYNRSYRTKFSDWSSIDLSYMCRTLSMIVYHTCLEHKSKNPKILISYLQNLSKEYPKTKKNWKNAFGQKSVWSPRAFKNLPNFRRSYNDLRTTAHVRTMRVEKKSVPIFPPFSHSYFLLDYATSSTGFIK